VAAINSRRAAILLMSLDAGTASELLRAAPPDLLREISAELAYLHTAGKNTKKSGKRLVEQFHRQLARGGELGGEMFIRGVFDESLGDQAEEAVDEVYDMVAHRDPFLGIKSAGAEDVARALTGEASQVVAVVLSELNVKKGRELMNMLEPHVREEAVCCLAKGLEISRRAREKVALAIQKNLNSQRDRGEKPTDNTTKFREIALLLQGLKADLRDSLVNALKSRDAHTGETISSLMVIWKDVKRINERCMQEVLRSIEAKGLALAMVGAEPAISEKISENVSERIRMMLEEEASLLSNPKEEEILAAREEILNGLRELNLKGELVFDSERAEDDEE